MSSTTVELGPVLSGHPAPSFTTVAPGPAFVSPTARDRPSSHTQAINKIYLAYISIVERSWEYICEGWLKLQELGNAFRRACASRCTRALENLRSHLLICWTKLRTHLKYLRQRCTLSAWLGVSSALVIGGISLRYAYVSIVLAEWTAKKEFQQLCQSLNVCPCFKIPKI